jgi:hypothetical protein
LLRAWELWGRLTILGIPDRFPLAKWKNLVLYNISSVSKLKFLEPSAGFIQNGVFFGETEPGQIFPILIMEKSFSRNT